MGHGLILISCCDHKVKGGLPEYSYEKSILPKLTEKTRSKVLHTRQTIFRLIKIGRTEDRLRAGGKRRDLTYNAELQDGPDLSANFLEESTLKGFYFPAYQRYDGRFFNAVGVSSFVKALSHDCHTLLVSGLYGLITLDEPIQAYNSYLADDVLPGRDEDSSESLSRQVKAKVGDLWGKGSTNLMNQSLIDFIGHHKQTHGHDIKFIIDLLSEYSYQMVFDWEYLHSRLTLIGLQAFHRAPLGISEPEFLPDLGRYYKHEIIEKSWCTKPQLELSSCPLYFQDLAGLSFSRDVQPDRYIEQKLINDISAILWSRLEPSTREELIQAETLFDLAAARYRGREDERADRNMHYFAALECELHNKIGKVPSKRDRYGNIKRKYGTIGEYHHQFNLDGEFCHLTTGRNKFVVNLREVKEIRNRAGHYQQDGRGGITWDELKNC